MKKKFFVLWCLFFSILFSVSISDSLAKEVAYPTRRIQFIYPWDPGTPNFVLARMLCERMEKILGEKITATAMPGGSGVKSHQYVLSQSADGYTLLDGWVAPLILAVVNRPDIGYTYRDFEPLGGLSFQPSTLVVRKDQPWKTLEEFVQYARKNPGMKYNSAGEITVPHAVMATFLKKAGIKAQGVPYPGIVAGFKDFLGGTLDFSDGYFRASISF